MFKTLIPARHPYYPTDIALDGFSPATLGMTTILSAFGLGAVVVVAAIWLLSGTYRQLTTAERVLMCWFAFTGITHFIVEGAVVLDDKFYTDTTGNILKEIWKEYAKADSRYATRDSFTISMEFVTAFMEGPGCFAILYGIAYRRSWRFTLQIMVSLGQLYGDVLYFATCYLEGFVHSRPEFLYFWVYFVIVNSIWIVIPSWIIWVSARHISSCVAAADRMTRPKAS
ncbi:hypothetical protein WJX73_002670 [Symbiochloris irregularis]|uniref:EXPERA domain-containing protein n=1 Tax=Symbiochloris irregularis TaxID=706552 RepID=A0AAW1NSL8_9CHLO